MGGGTSVGCVGWEAEHLWDVWDGRRNICGMCGMGGGTSVGCVGWEVELM